MLLHEKIFLVFFSAYGLLYSHQTELVWRSGSVMDCPGRPGVRFPVWTVYLPSFMSFARDSKWGAVSKWPRSWRDVKHKQANIFTSLQDGMRFQLSNILFESIFIWCFLMTKKNYEWLNRVQHRGSLLNILMYELMKSSLNQIFIGVTEMQIYLTETLTLHWN